ncbi:TPA: glycosyltransferase [Morganella morganii]|nr:glycosyltransferase [Morganella morganii]
MNIFYTGAFRYPDLDAAGKRVATIVQYLSEKHKITVGGWEKKAQENTKDHISFNVLDKHYKNPILRLFNFLTLGFKLLPYIIKNKKKYDCYILYNPPCLFAYLIYIYCKINNKKLILDSTEWYESDHLVGGRYGIAAIENYLRMKYVYKKYKNIITISDYLSEYYHGRHIVNIPPMSHKSVFAESYRISNNRELNLIYAGSPGKKDKINIIIKIIDMLTIEQKKHVTLHLIGFTQTEFLQKYPRYTDAINSSSNNFIFYGRIPMSSVYNLYPKMDYMIFFRENKRYANAGFPSKFVEALSFSLPVITNSIGEIKKYFPDVGILFEPDEDAPSKLIENAIDNKNNYSYGISNTLKNNFTIDSNKEKILSFMDNLI